MNKSMEKTVTIGISAHNEEHNIALLLNSILGQRQSGYILDFVIVACDGCTDKTALVVSEYARKYDFIRCIDDGQRVGKSERMKQLFVENKSDVFVLLDADTTLASSETVRHLVAPFVDDTKIGMVAGCDKPYPPRTFFESIVITGVDLWWNIRHDYNGSDTVHNSHGCVLVFSRELVQRADIHPDINGHDHYMYFRAKELGFSFEYAEDAVVYYREPSNFRDYILQRSRFYVINESMILIFGSWAETYYAGLPVYRKLTEIIKMFLKKPILLPLALLLETFTRFYMLLSRPKPIKGVWQTIQSTK
jgi:cellulose synthase/poly-beta-1,6-N-acetylglucosamine synthase-like glycosyltransferase